MSTFYAMLDDQTVERIEAETWAAAAEKEPGNTHWLFSEEGLREFVANAQSALKGASNEVKD